MKLEDFQWDSLYIWVDKQTGAGTEGKIGMDQFDSRWISIDYDRQELSLSDEMPPGLDAQGNKLSSVKTRGANFLVAGQSIEDVEVNFFTGSIGRMQMSIIGSEILSSFNPVIDLEDKRIWLRPRES